MTLTSPVEMDLLAMLDTSNARPAIGAEADHGTLTLPGISPVGGRGPAFANVTEYDDAMQQKAAEAHDVIARSGLAAPGPRPRHLIFTDASKRVRVADLDDEDGAVAHVRSANVAIDVIEAEIPVEDKPDVTRPIPVLFADEATVRRVISGFRKAAERDGGQRRRYLSAANRLALVTSMRFSVLRPVLTRVLQHRYWLPKRHNAYQWQDWAAAWSQTARVARSAGQLELLARLVELAFHHGGSHPLLESVRSSLLIKESAAWHRAASSRAVHTHSTYRFVIEFEAAWNEANQTDPLLLERNALSGDVAVGNVVQPRAVTQILLDNTPRFNETNLWAAVDGQRYKVTRQNLITGPENSLIMVLHTNRLAERALAAGRAANLSVTLYPQRFTMPTATPRTDNAWLNPAQKDWTPRPVPTDVLLAGAPTGE